MPTQQLSPFYLLSTRDVSRVISFTRPSSRLTFSGKGSTAREDGLGTRLPYSHTPNNANPNLNYTFLQIHFWYKGTSSFIQVPIRYISLESPFPAPEHTRALFSSKCVYQYFVSPGYMFMWFYMALIIIVCRCSPYPQST